MSSIDACLAENAKYAAQFSKANLPRIPASGIAVVTCMDARLDTIALLGLAEGDAHVIRNAGGVLTDDVIRSLIVSQRLLGTREIMLIHHTDCGMLTVDEEELSDEIHSDTGFRPAFSLGAFDDLDESVRRSVASIEQNPLLEHKEAVRGFIYEVETGKLREVS